MLVYSVCSVEPEEGEQVINDFLKTGRDFSIIDAEALFLKEFVKDGTGHSPQIIWTGFFGWRYAEKIKQLYKDTAVYCSVCPHGTGVRGISHCITGFSRTVEVPSIARNMTLLEANEALTRAGHLKGEDLTRLSVRKDHKTGWTFRQ